MKQLQKIHPAFKSHAVTPACWQICIINYGAVTATIYCQGTIRHLHCLEQGSPTPGPWTGIGPGPIRNRAAQQEVSGGQASEASPAAPHRSHYLLNHSPRLPPRSVEKLSSMKSVPGAKKVGDRWIRTHLEARD